MARALASSLLRLATRSRGPPVQLKGLCCLAVLASLIIWDRAAVPLDAPEFEPTDADKIYSSTFAAIHAGERPGETHHPVDSNQRAPKKPRCNRGDVITPHDFGAQGDGVMDDTNAVLKAFKYAGRCEGIILLIGPRTSSFFVSPGKLRVELHNIVLRFEGDLVGPSLMLWNPSQKTWPVGSCAYAEANCSGRGGPSPEYARSQWSLLHIRNSSNITMHGPGGLRAPGWTFWLVRYHRPEVRAYCLLKLQDSQNIKVASLKLADSPMYQFIIMHSSHVILEKLSISISLDKVEFGKDVGKWGPENTDGVSIFASHDVTLLDSDIESGDDNVVIKESSHDIRGERLILHRGKGISVGSLGETDAHHHTVNVWFKDVQVDRCRHGVRIKTWKGGSGTLRNASFEGFRLNRVRVGILIDQSYCPPSQRPEGCANSSNAVSIENVSFKSFAGTFTRADGAAEKKIDCVRCSGITYDEIDMRLSGPPRTIPQGTPLPKTSPPKTLPPRTSTPLPKASPPKTLSPRTSAPPAKASPSKTLPPRTSAPQAKTSPPKTLPPKTSSPRRP